MTNIKSTISYFNLQIEIVYYTTSETLVEIVRIIDANIFISYYNEDDQNHKKAIKILEDIENGKYGNAIISDYIFDEIITVSLMKIKDKQKIIAFGSAILKSETRILKVNKDIFRKAWQLFLESNLRMSFTDFTNFAILQLLKIKNIATFDKDFKKIKNIKVIDN